MDKLVTVSWLKEREKEQDVRIIDCRFVLGNPEAGRAAYEEGHIPGAIYWDLERDLSAPKAEHGGRHPWPSVDAFVRTVEEAGITHEMRVVLYDDQNGAMAARAYQLLRYIGHEQAALLNGGYAAWKAAYPLTKDVPDVQRTNYEPRIADEMLRSMEDVRANCVSGNALLIDSRAYNRYTGEAETVDPVGGHIPGAVNYDWQHVVNHDGTWKTHEELERHFADVPHDRDVIVYCGSGVTACANLFALERIGYRNVKLYPGSWSDWISYADNEKKQGAQP
ncbi:thiosulfate/3-mercaptopyruvate sulfurtransferase [Aneurinibacillus soli]|uniref:3-mercaptopyruvate sulfurtransferase n=1 Tax=Aneurinibacillus soli TaxID=1500254 RepID=A0A0U4WK02_9BACL|nr:sulfurtransferase [Aneurinibacillus soli]PYE63101.1 thiosulfate/3-mercaptopyruvate sulfurtransferase [Aneurinibacillus soli]BAU28841.1 3-mercaptopyruvate sulfurtransferase [Aneurinibacillus soli]